MFGKKQWLDAGQLTWAVGGPAAAYAFLQAAAPASRGRSTVLCQLRITGPLVGHRGGKQAKAGLSEMLRTPAAGNPLLPCPAQPTRRVGLKGSTEKCCFWFTDVITPTVCRPRLISLDTCWQEAIGRLPCWNGSVTEKRGLGSQPFWHSSPFLFMQGFLKDGLFGLLLTRAEPSWFLSQPSLSHLVWAGPSPVGGACFTSMAWAGSDGLQALPSLLWPPLFHSIPALSYLHCLPVHLQNASDQEKTDIPVSSPLFAPLAHLFSSLLQHSETSILLHCRVSVDQRPANQTLGDFPFIISISLVHQFQIKHKELNYYLT